MARHAKRSRKRRLIRLGIIGLTVMVVGSIATVETTSQSWFCNSCHIMEPFYESWHDSAHKDIKCVKCHIDPGVDSFMAAKLNGLGQVVDDVLNRTSNKPSAAVHQMACLRSGCHSLETIEKTTVNGERFNFVHGKHVGKEYYGIPINCTTCHSHVQGDSHFEVNTNACVTCHMVEREQEATSQARAHTRVNLSDGIIRLAVRQGHTSAETPEGKPPNDCKTCHDAPDEPFDYNGLTIDHSDFLAYGAACESCHRGSTAMPSPIDDDSCLSCHVFGVEKSLPTEEIHSVHAEGKHKIECFSCHGNVRHGPAAQLMTLGQFDCRRCHTDQHAVQQLTYLHEDEPIHTPSSTERVSPMFMAHVDCAGCHTERQPFGEEPSSGARVAYAAAESCDACHQPGLGERMIPLWQDATRELYQKAETELTALEAESLVPESVRLVVQARGLLDLVRMDGSWGVHNPLYTQRLLEQAREVLAEARVANESGG